MHQVKKYIKTVWELPHYYERRREALKIIRKVNRILRSRGSTAHVINYNHECDNVLNLYVHIVETEFSTKTVSALEDLREKLNVHKVSIIVGNITKVRIQKDEVKLPAKIPRIHKEDGLKVPLGYSTRDGSQVWLDMKLNPHLLIAGSTNRGKSVCLENIILHIDQYFLNTKFIMIDPKRIELTGFEKLPSLYSRIITEPIEAIEKVNDVCKLMDRRYETMRSLQTKEFSALGEPRIILIVDEYADLMAVSKVKDEESDELFSLETGIQRIAQLGRAAGIHLIVATQRPSADVITGIIKTNIPTRIAFGVGDAMNSRIILDQGGAELLRKPGLGLLKAENGIEDFQGIFISEEEQKSYVEKRHKDSQPIFTVRRIAGSTDTKVAKKLFGKLTRSEIIAYLSKKEVYKAQEARSDLKLSAPEALALGKLLDEQEVVKPRGRARIIVAPKLFSL